jgi:hypothetical protein
LSQRRSFVACASSPAAHISPFMANPTPFSIADSLFLSTGSTFFVLFEPPLHVPLSPPLGGRPRLEDRPLPAAGPTKNSAIRRSVPRVWVQEKVQGDGAASPIGPHGETRAKGNPLPHLRNKGLVSCPRNSLKKFSVARRAIQSWTSLVPP